MDISFFTIFDTNKLRMTGNEIETRLDQIVSITYASTVCKLDETNLDSSSATCTLQDDLVAGDHTPIFKT